MFLSKKIFFFIKKGEVNGARNMTFLSISLSSQKVSEEIVEKKKEKTTLGLLSRILLNNNLRVDIQCDEWKTRKHIEREREREKG
jgi:hypothetical protein